MYQWGKLAVRHLAGPRVIEVAGEAPDWLAGLASAEIQERWSEFEESWRTVDHLPPWMAEELARPRALPAGLRTLYPGTTTRERLRIYSRAMGLAHESPRLDPQAHAGLDYLAGIPVEELPRPLRAWLRAQLLAQLGEYEQLQPELERVLECHPEFIPARLLQATAFEKLRKPQLALRILELCVRAWPTCAQAWDRLANALLRRRKYAEATQVIQRAIEAGVPPVAMQRSSRTLAKVRGGPLWIAPNV